MPKKSFDTHNELLGMFDDTAEVFFDDAPDKSSVHSLISIQDIKVSSGRRPVDASKVKDLVKSINEVGLINPITLTRDNRLIAGAHRVQAFKDMGLTEIPFTYLEKDDDLLIELAEIDENLVRGELHFLEQSRVLERRKEIYEQLYPETKHGGDRRSEDFKWNQIPLENNVEDKGSENFKWNRVPLDSGESAEHEPIPSFADDTAAKTGFTPRKIRQDIQLSRDLTDKAKKAIEDYNATKKEALQLSRMSPEKQNEIADRSVEAGSISGAIRLISREAMKRLPSLEQLKQESETAEERQLRYKSKRSIERVLQSAEYLKKLNARDYQRDAVKGNLKIYKDKRGEYTFYGKSSTGWLESEYYDIPDGYTIYMCAGTELIILNEHSLICHLGTDFENDKPIIIDSADPEGKDGVIIELVKAGRK